MALKQRYTITDVGFSPSNNFLSFQVEFSKKPWWRKIISI
jgi:hypothetical protein